MKKVKNKKPWRLFGRSARRLRRMADRSNGEYDGSHWKLIKRFETQEEVESNLSLRKKKEPYWAYFIQYKIMHDNEGRP
jgi:hypothetical protein